MKTTTERIELIARAVCDCKRCGLHELRTQAVPGNGNPLTRLVVVGEAPGQNEDEQGVPFVGKAGQLLDNILAAAGIRREDVFVTNAAKCRPPQNRTPRPEEIAACNGFLRLQLKSIDPQAVLCLGVVAAQAVIGNVESVGSVRGEVHSVDGRAVVCTYHPSYLLRNPSAKPLVWDDVQLLLAVLRQEAAATSSTGTSAG